MQQILQTLKEQLFDAPSDIKYSFNTLVNYFSREEVSEKLQHQIYRLSDSPIEVRSLPVGIAFHRIFGLSMAEYGPLDSKATFRRFRDHATLDFTLQNSWRVFRIDITNHNVVASVYYHGTDPRSKTLAKLINQDEENGELNMITKIFNEGNLSHLANWVFVDSK